MNITEEQLEEIADEVLEVIDEQLAPLDLPDCIEAIDAIKAAVGGREDVIRADVERQAREAAG